MLNFNAISFDIALRLFIVLVKNESRYRYNIKFSNRLFISFIFIAFAFDFSSVFSETRRRKNYRELSE